MCIRFFFAGSCDKWNLIDEDARQELGLVVGDDGEFWISESCFLEHFDLVDFCHLDPGSMVQEAEDDGEVKKHWEVVKFEGSWVPGFNAAGWTEDKEKFATNPQYLVTLREPDDEEEDGECTMIVALLQRGRRFFTATDDTWDAIGFFVYEGATRPTGTVNGEVDEGGEEGGDDEDEERVNDDEAEDEVEENVREAFDLVASSDGTINCYSLQTLLKNLTEESYSVNRHVLKALVLRYGHDRKISLSDFIGCAVKLMCMIDIYCDLDPNNENAIVLSRNEDTALDLWLREGAYKRGPYEVVHLSDGLRLALLLKHGGVYVDTDVVFLRTMDGVGDAVVAHSADDTVTNNFFAFPAHHPFIQECLSDFVSGYYPKEWGYNGPRQVF
ncbi:hypothetical protein V5799_031673 [Amblyomma americanum]|uniref:Calpain catalytic domain-containing protein n=1 Tax=Amblyomma americanum TaxID=6943 RepID=A0AAQ4DTD3_AMBAM